ncbi:hypothetical protein ACQ86O_26455 [Serratia sp. L9]|uniref:hypothetical protein n=1 Tax=Serratia sp. L9 TaxID=3423946 RepID=UPI003D6794CC
MLFRVARWLFQLPGKVFAPIFRSRLTLVIFFAVVAAGIFAIKQQRQPEEIFTLAAPQNYVIQREAPLREAREHCVGPLPDNQGQPWPASAGFLHQPDWKTGSKLQAFTLDNQHNKFAVLVKLESAARQTLAEVFLPAASSFNIKLQPDTSYVMKVKDINSGCSFRTVFSVADNHDGRLPLTLTAEGSERYHPITNSKF